MHGEGASESDHARPSGGVSWLMAACLIIKTQWGIGMMAMPFMIVQGGLLAGIIQFIISMVLTCDSIFRLIAVRGEHRARRAVAASPSSSMADSLINDNELLKLPEDNALDYNGIVRAALGPQMEVLSHVAIALSNSGSCVAFAIFISTNLVKFVPHVLAAWQWLALVAVPVWLALSTRRDLNFLAPFSVVGLACALGFEFVMLADAGRVLGWSGLADWLRTAPLIQPSTLPIAISLSAFCNEGVVLMSLTVQASMARPASFPSAMLTALTIFTVCYLLLGVGE